MIVDLAEPTSAVLHAVVIRADGTEIDLGVVDAKYKDPAVQFMWVHFGKPLADRRIARANKQLARQESK